MGLSVALNTAATRNTRQFLDSGPIHLCPHSNHRSTHLDAFRQLGVR
ncbi:unnamed protein product, partial [Mycena citricolor]